MEFSRNVFFVEERRRNIVSYINKIKKVTVSQLAEVFNVSDSTIRNDLKVLDNLGLIHRTHGGALKLFNDQVAVEPPLSEKEQLMITEKQAIAKLAANYVNDNDTIAIATGTTVFEFAKAICSKKNLTIITNNIQIASYFETNCAHDILIIGGLLMRNFHYTIFSEEIMPKINIDKIFFSCNGFDIKRGATIPDFYLASNLRLMISQANSSFLLCDSSKIGKINFAQIALSNEITKIITDKHIDEKFVNEYFSEGNNNLEIS